MSLTQSLQAGVPLWDQSAQEREEHPGSPELHLPPTAPSPTPGEQSREGERRGRAGEDRRCTQAAAGLPRGCGRTHMPTSGGLTGQRGEHRREQRSPVLKGGPRRGGRGVERCNSFQRERRNGAVGTLSLISLKLRIGEVTLEAISTD